MYVVGLGSGDISYVMALGSYCMPGQVNFCNQIQSLCCTCTDHGLLFGCKLVVSSGNVKYFCVILNGLD